ncbi:MAG TPA: hypothetical protein VFE98_10590 [Candidatus Bathyarchaeia archaeon]|nr:hypothetical protein [Candidatus Bathyarchaeia archaeon]
MKLTYTWFTTLLAEEPYKRKVKVPCDTEGAKATTITMTSTATKSVRLHEGYR